MVHRLRRLGDHQESLLDVEEELLAEAPCALLSFVCNVHQPNFPAACALIIRKILTCCRGVGGFAFESHDYEPIALAMPAGVSMPGFSFFQFFLKSFTVLSALSCACYRPFFNRWTTRLFSSSSIASTTRRKNICTDKTRQLFPSNQRSNTVMVIHVVHANHVVLAVDVVLAVHVVFESTCSPCSHCSPCSP